MRGTDLSLRAHSIHGSTQITSAHKNGRDRAIVIAQPNSNSEPPIVFRLVPTQSSYAVLFERVNAQQMDREVLPAHYFLVPDVDDHDGKLTV